MSNNSSHADAPAKNSRFGITFLFENSLFLIGGAILALVWANWNEHSYHDLVHFTLFNGSIGHGLSLHFLVNDVFMALFFAIAAKEVWESCLPGGALSNLRTAATPLMATLGGVAVPALLYLLGAAMTGQLDSLGRGWAVPCATDIAFSYLVARLIFGKGHPAISFLLLLAIADDAAGLVILAIAYPQQAMRPEWLMLTALAIGTGLMMRKLGVRNFWWYLLIPGVMSWFSFYMTGIHAALGLAPIIPTLPHAKTDLGLFAPQEAERTDTLNAFEHWWKNPVELILGLFGLVNAGVVFSNIGTGTWLVLAGLLIGKPLGITIFTWMGVKLFKLQMPQGMGYRHIVSLGMVAGIGFTVALFVSTAAFHQPGPIQDSIKMGALGSFLAAFMAIGIAKLLKIHPVTDYAEDETPQDKPRAEEPEEQPRELVSV